jgi:peroxin-5
MMPAAPPPTVLLSTAATTTTVVHANNNDAIRPTLQTTWYVLPNNAATTATTTTMDQAWQQQQQQQQHHSIHSQPPHVMRMHPVIQQQQQHYHHHVMQQHHAIMMQQQQQVMHQRMQQLQLWQQQQQKQNNQHQQQVANQIYEDDDKTELSSNKQQQDVNDWHNGLEDEITVRGHEGLAHDVTIEELAAAWAQAEAEYDDAQNSAVNLAAVYDAHEDTTTTNEFYPYDFEETSSTTEPSQQQQQQQEDWMTLAEMHFQKGNVRNAISCLETELQYHDPENSKAWYLLGKCHAENDEDRKAIACLERAVERDPYSPDINLACAVSHVNELNHERALYFLKNYMTHHPKYAGFELEDIYASSENKETSFDQAQRLLLRADPNDPNVQEALGVVYNVSRDYDAAVIAFRRALQLNTDKNNTIDNSYSLWNKLGATLANANRSEEALPAYQHALTLRPKYARAWLNMAISHSNLKNYNESARCYLQTLSLNPSAKHCWSYLRIALSCSERWDLIPLAAAQDLSAFVPHYDFVLYS